MNPERKRILIIKLSSLGDIFHAIPAVHNLQAELDAEIDWVTQPEYVDLVKCLPMVSTVIPFPRRKFWSRAGALVKAVRAKRYDYVVDLQGLLKSAVVARFARGSLRIGPSFEREGARFFYDVVAGPKNKDRHAVDESLDVVRYLGLTVRPVIFPIQFPAPVMDVAAPRIGLVPWSRRFNKNWPAEHFIEVARRIRADFGGTIFLFGSQADWAGCEDIKGAVADSAGGGEIVNLAGKTSLVEMGGWFSRMNLVLVNDSGPLHMAVALGVPVVTMFGPTDPRRTGPYGSGHQVLSSVMDCCPCFGKECTLPVVECMRRITPDQVMGAVRSVLQVAKGNNVR
jgi:lipopolysaccharide heptosyltransferase I